MVLRIISIMLIIVANLHHGLGFLLSQCENRFQRQFLSTLPVLFSQGFDLILFGNAPR